MLRETESSATRLFLKLVDGEVITCYINTYTYSGLLTQAVLLKYYKLLSSCFCRVTLSKGVIFKMCILFSSLFNNVGKKWCHHCALLRVKNCLRAQHFTYSTQQIFLEYSKELSFSLGHIHKYIHLSCQCHSDSKFHINLLTTKSGFEISTSIPQSTAK